MNMSDKDHITELETEINRLKSELEKTKEQARELEKSRQAMLFMLEDLNGMMTSISTAKKEWEATFDSISDPLFIHDKKFKIVRTNKAYKEAAELKFNEIVGRLYFEVFPKMDGPFQMCLKASELQEEEEEEEEEFSCPVTNRIFNVRFYPIKDIDNKLLYSIHIMEDITERKKAEERIRQEMEVNTHLLMISEATVHTTDIDKLMEQVVHCCSRIIRCNICLSYLWDKKEGVFMPYQSFGLPSNKVPLFRTEPFKESAFIQKFFKDKRVAVLSAGDAADIAGAGGWFPLWLEKGNIKTIAIIPLIGRKDYLGLVIGLYSNDAELGERDMKVMEGIMHQVSVAVEDANMYKESIDKAMELSNKIETIKAMHEIDRAILSTLNTSEILETAARMVGRLIPCERATVSLADKDKGGFVYAAGFGVESIPKGTVVPFKDTSVTQVIETGRPQYENNLKDAKDLLPLEKRLLDEGFLSHIRTPLVVKGETIGVLSVGAKRPSAFTPESLETLERLVSQIGVALENARLIADLEGLFLGTVRSLSFAIDAKSPWTKGHSDRVTKYALAIGREVRLDEKTLKELEVAGFLHDIGKLGTYEAILDKAGKLTGEELNIIRQHPGKGAEILSPIKQLKDIIPAIKYHHEFYDGKGYPEGLKGEAIPFMARILAVADSADAMGADRPYRTGRPMDAIIAELKRCSGTQFDPKVVDGFLKVVSERPEVFKTSQAVEKAINSPDYTD